MSTSTVISSVEFIPLPPAAPQNRRPAKGPKASKRSEALESNASESLVTDTSVAGEYVETTQSVERRVEPISRAILSNPNTTMAQLHKMATHELDVLDALNNEGRQVIRMHLMAIWNEMSVRFERGESIKGISGTGGKGMGKYLRSIGIDPAKRRSWKFEIRQQEALRLAQENPPTKTPRTTKKEIIIKSETEADLIAKAGVRMAQKLVGDGMTTPQERVNKAAAMAQDILEAIADGRYARLEPLSLPKDTPAPEGATYGYWENHHLPASDFSLKYFEEAARDFKDRYHHAFQGSAFKKILEMLKDKPDQVLSNAQDFTQLAVVLKGAADNLNLLAAAITAALTPLLEPEPEPTQEPGPPQESEPESPTLDAPASAPASDQKEKPKDKYTPRKTANGYGVFVAGEQDCAVDGLPTMNAAWEQIEKLKAAGSLLLGSETSHER
jgi:hypothetical protein